MRKLLLAGIAAISVLAGAFAAIGGQGIPARAADVNSHSAVNSLDMIRVGQHRTG